MSLRATQGDFPVLAGTVDGLPVRYLDSAASSLTPQAVIDATMRYYTTTSANIHRGKHILSEQASDAYEAARSRVAEFVGTTADTVVFTANTTQGLNLLAAGLRLPVGSRALVSADAHHSLQLPLRQRFGVEPIATAPDGGIDLAAFEAQLGDGSRSDIALVAITHCSNVSGRYAPVAELAAMARERGAIVVLDAAQSAPHRSLRLAELGVDALAFSGHKMLGPTGIGVLVVGRRLVDELDPVTLGGGVVDWVDRDRWRLRRPPHRFEPGTPHIAGAYGLHAAVDYLDGLGMEAVAEHDRELAAELYRLATERDYLRVMAPGAGDRSATLSVRVEGIDDLSELARALSDSYGVMCRSGHLCSQPYVDEVAGGAVLRLSAYVYNTVDDLRAAFDALDELHPLLADAR